MMSSSAQSQVTYTCPMCGSRTTATLSPTATVTAAEHAADHQGSRCQQSGLVLSSEASERLFGQEWVNLVASLLTGNGRAVMTPDTAASLSTSDRYEVVRQPRVGDTLDTGRHGRVEVLAVRARGITLVVRDTLGREWTVSREPARGHWVRVGSAS